MSARTMPTMWRRIVPPSLTPCGLAINDRPARLVSAPTALRVDLPSSDPVALAVAIGLLLGAALTAIAIPVLRAARKDPWAVLKD